MIPAPYTQPEQQVQLRKWANNLLYNHGIEIRNNKKDLSSTTNYILLIETITRQSIGGLWYPNPTNVMEMRTNASSLILFLEQNSLVEPGHVKIDDIMWGDENTAYEVMWILKNNLKKGRTQPITQSPPPIIEVPSSPPKTTVTRPGTSSIKLWSMNPTKAIQKTQPAKLYNYTQKSHYERPVKPKKKARKPSVPPMSSYDKSRTQPNSRTVTPAQKRRISRSDMTKTQNVPRYKPLEELREPPKESTKSLDFNDIPRPVFEEPNTQEINIKLKKEQNEEIIEEKPKIEKLTPPKATSTPQPSSPPKEATLPPKQIETPVKHTNPGKTKNEPEPKPPKQQSPREVEKPIPQIEPHKKQIEKIDPPKEIKAEEPIELPLKIEPNNNPKEPISQPTPEIIEDQTNNEEVNEVKMEIDEPIIEEKGEIEKNEETHEEIIPNQPEQENEKEPEPEPEQKSEPIEIEPKEPEQIENELPEEKIEDIVEEDQFEIHDPIVFERSNHVVGIDLGTSYCKFKIFRNDKIDESISDCEFPSIVTFSPTEHCIGKLKHDNESVEVTSVKRLIGKDFTDSTFKECVMQLPYEVSQMKSTGRPIVSAFGENYSPEQITSFLLTEVRKRISSQLREEVIDAVISVPAFFSNSQKQATRDAGEIAGFHVMRIVSETVAAVMSYNSRNPESTLKDNVLVFDMGGGKLDITIMSNSTMLRTVGSTQLGGIDFTYLLKEIVHKENAEEIKIALSSQDEYEGITRKQLEEACEPLFVKIIKMLDEAFNGSKVTKESINKIFFIGGATKMPKLRNVVIEYFNGTPSAVDAISDEVARGAAMQGAILKGNNSSSLLNIEIKNTTPLSLGFSLADGTTSVLIPRGTVIPVKLSTETTTFKDNQMNVGFDIVEGERKIAADNIKLGDVCVEGIEQAPRGVPKILITMEINEDGILVVTANDKKTGAKITTTIQNSGNLSKSEVENLIKEAEANKQLDDMRKKKAESKSKLQFFIDRVLNASKQLEKEMTEKLAPIIKEYSTWLSEHQDEETTTYLSKLMDAKQEIQKIIHID